MVEIDTMYIRTAMAAHTHPFKYESHQEYCMTDPALGIDTATA